MFFWTNLHPGISMDVTFTLSTYLSISADQSHPTIAPPMGNPTKTPPPNSSDTNLMRSVEIKQSSKITTHGSSPKHFRTLEVLCCLLVDEFCVRPFTFPLIQLIGMHEYAHVSTRKREGSASYEEELVQG